MPKETLGGFKAYDPCRAKRCCAQNVAANLCNFRDVEGVSRYTLAPTKDIVAPVLPRVVIVGTSTARGVSCWFPSENKLRCMRRRVLQLHCRMSRSLGCVTKFPCSPVFVFGRDDKEKHQKGLHPAL